MKNCNKNYQNCKHGCKTDFGNIWYCKFGSVCGGIFCCWKDKSSFDINDIDNIELLVLAESLNSKDFEL